MKRSKEEYENLINNSPLFDTDKQRDYSLYKARRLNLLELIAQYYAEYIYSQKPLDGYGTTLIETADECIRYYDKSRGEFLRLLKNVMKRNLGIARAKSLEDGQRKGIKLSKDVSKKIRMMLSYAESRKLDILDIAVQEQIANVIGIKLQEAAELIRINSDAVAINSFVTNADGDEAELFDLVSSDEASAERQAVELAEAEELIDKIEAAFDLLQNRPATKRLLSMLLTANFIREFDGEAQILSLIEGKAFYSEEILKIRTGENRVPLAREIADVCGVSEQSASRTYKNFIVKINANR